MTQLPLRTAVSDTYPLPSNSTAKAGLGAIWDALSETLQSGEVHVASAATVDIGGQASTRLYITGTTGITSFGTTYRSPILLRFASALTLTHNATTLRCPGNVDITTAAGDVMIAWPTAASISGSTDGWQVAKFGSGTDSPFISVTDFGAVGDGVTDDTTAFQAALDSSYQHLYIPAGDYALSNKLTHSGKAITITGAGINTSRLIWGSGSTDTGASFTQADDDFHIKISDVSFVTGKAGTGTAIAVDGSGQIVSGDIQNRSKHRLECRNIEFRGATGVNIDGWEYGIDAVSIMIASVDNLHFAGKYLNQPYNITSKSLCRFSGAGNPTQITVSNCSAYYTQEATRFSDVEGAFVSTCNFVSVDKGVVFNNASGEPQLQCQNNHINAYVAGVEVTAGSQCNISNNLIYSRSGALSTVYGVHMLGTCIYNLINNNVFVAAAGAGTLDGIVLESGSTRTVIAGNAMQSTGVGVEFKLGADNNTLGQNELGSGTFVDSGSGNSTVRIRPDRIDISNIKVLGSRDTGWGATMTGTADKTTIRDVTTVTTTQLAARFKALEDALRTHGLIGS